jgi:glycosyltransferase involved in cell wall biosynthesis
MPLVSVIIPTYNCSLYIRETISSILLQENAPDIEIIVINDGSTDETGDIARSFGDPVKVIDQKNSGVCSARNHGVKRACGDFMAFVDHDDFWMPNKLSNQLAAFAAHPNVDVVFTDFCRWNIDAEDGNYPSPAQFTAGAKPQGFDSELTGWIYHQMLLSSWILTSTALAKSNAIYSSGGFNESLPYSEDWDFWLRISRQCQFLKLNEKSTLYRQHPDQGSRLVRPIDYRSLLLMKASKEWGLCSQDGHCVSPGEFRRFLAKCSASFGLEHLRATGDAHWPIAARAFLKAWSIDPFYIKSLGYLAASSFGWKPGWHSPNLRDNRKSS